MRIEHILLLTQFYLTAATTKTAKDNKAILKQLSELDTFKDRIDLAEKELDHISSGSSRIVYGFGDDQILKLAKNEKGLAQNKAEANPKIKSKFVNETIKADKDGIWKISPRRDKITEKEFEKMTGINFKDFGEALEYGLRSISKDSDPKKPKDYYDIAKTEIFKEIVRVAKAGKLLPGDLTRVSTFGKTKDHPIILDAGLTSDIYRDFYDSDTEQRK